MPADVENLVLRSLECPLCRAYMTPPLKQCQNGHCCCEKCREAMPACSLCSAAFTDSRNLLLEEMAHKVEVRCRHAAGGCRAMVKLANKQEHEEACPARGFGCAFPGCGWVGPKSGLLAHWASKNLSVKPLCATNVLHIKLGVMKTFVNVVIAHSELFWYRFKRVGDLLYFSVQHLGVKQRAQDFYYEVEFPKIAVAKKRVVLGSLCAHAAEDDFANPKNCCVAHLATLQDFVSTYDVLLYYLRICPIEPTDKPAKKGKHAYHKKASAPPPKAAPKTEKTVTTGLPKYKP